MVIFICVLFLTFDLANDGCLGKAKFNFPKPPAKTSLTSTYHPDANHTDFQHELAATAFAGNPLQVDCPLINSLRSAYYPDNALLPPQQCWRHPLVSSLLSSCILLYIPGFFQQEFSAIIAEFGRKDWVLGSPGRYLP
jgi:hypothetical protein